MAAFLTQNATMRTLLIVHHTLTGGTLQMVQAAQQGAAGEPDVQVRLLSAQETGVGDLLAATGYLFATPENLASMAGMMKDFLTARITARWVVSRGVRMRAWSVPAAMARARRARWHALPRAGA